VRRTSSSALHLVAVMVVRRTRGMHRRRCNPRRGESGAVHFLECAAPGCGDGCSNDTWNAPKKVQSTKRGVWCGALSSVRCTWLRCWLFEEHVECTQEGAIHEEIEFSAVHFLECAALGCGAGCSKNTWNAPKKVQSTKRGVWCGALSSVRCTWLR
jgi:hypothetical protein